MKTKNYEHLIRIVTLLKLLEISQRTIPNLALVIGISEHTVCRYLHIVRASGFCVVHNSRQEYTLVNNYGVPRLSLTALEVKALIKACTDYYSLMSEIPVPIVLSGLFKITESVNNQMISLLKEKLKMDEGKLVSGSVYLTQIGTKDNSG